MCLRVDQFSDPARCSDVCLGRANPQPFCGGVSTVCNCTLSQRKSGMASGQCYLQVWSLEHGSPGSIFSSVCQTNVMPDRFFDELAERRKRRPHMGFFSQSVSVTNNRLFCIYADSRGNVQLVLEAATGWTTLNFCLVWIGNVEFGESVHNFLHGESMQLCLLVFLFFIELQLWYVNLRSSRDEHCVCII